MELCSTVFLVSTFWKLFVTGTLVKILFDYVVWLGWIAVVKSNFIYDVSQTWTNYPHFVMLGILNGWIAAFWLFCFSNFLQWKKQLPGKLLTNRYFYCFCATTIIAILAWPLGTSRKGAKGIESSLFSWDDLAVGDPKMFSPNRVWLQMLATVVFRSFAIMCMATMPIPSGITGASVCQGAFIGRFYGEILRFYTPTVQPQAFAIVGGAAFGGVLTRCTSITILLIEMTGQVDLSLGVMTGAMFSYAVANCFTMSAFNTGMTLGKMPYLPFMFYSSLYKRRVKDFMENTTDSLPEKSNLAEITNFYFTQEIFTNDDFIPVVEDAENLKMIGSVRSWNMLEYIKQICRAIVEETKEGNCEDLLQEFAAKLGDNINPKQSFCDVSEKLSACIEDIRRHESNLDFANGGLNNIAGKVAHQSDKDEMGEALAYVVAKSRGEAEDQDTATSLFLELVLCRMTTDWENPILRYNTYPIVVDETTKLVKVHFLFQMLGIGQVFVGDRGKLQGKLTITNFLNLRYTEQTYL